MTCLLYDGFSSITTGLREMMVSEATPFPYQELNGI
jgi:hypothetical protein